MKRWLTYSMLAVLLLLLISLFVLLMTNWGLSLVIAIVGLFIPGQLSISQVNGDLLGPVQFGSIEYRHDSIQLSINQLELDWHPDALITGDLHVTSLVVDKLNIVLPASTDESTDTASADFGSVVLPLAITLDKAQIGHVQFVIHQQQPILIDDIILSLQAVQDILQIKQLALNAYDASLNTSGTIKLRNNIPLKLQTELVYKLSPQQSLHSRGDLEGDLKELRLQQHISGLADAELTGKVFDLTGSLRWESLLRLHELNAMNIAEDLPQFDVMGDTTAKGDLNDITLQSDLQVEEKTFGKGNMHIQSSMSLANIEYQFSVNGDFVGVDVPQTTLHISGRGNLDGLSLPELNIQLLNGTIDGQGTVQWSPALLLDTDLNVNGIDFAGLSRQWPGKLNAQLALKTSNEHDRRQYTVELSDVKGELRGYPLQAKVRASWDMKTLSVHSAHATIEKSIVDVKGTVGDSWDFKFSASSPDVKQLWPDVEGNFDLTGQITGKINEPGLTMSVKGTDLVYDFAEVQQVAVQIQAGMSSTAALNVDMNMNGIESRVGHWRSLTLVANGTNKSHTLALDLQNEASAYATRLTGSFVPWRWYGKMTALDVRPEDAGQWTLKQPVELELQPTGIQFSELCLLRDVSNLCAELIWMQDKRMAKMSSVAFPLQLARYWVPKNIALNGELDLNGRLDGNAQGTYSGHIDISADDNAIAVNFVDINETLTLAKSNIRVQLDDTALQAKVHLPLSEGGGVDSEVQLKQWSVHSPFARNQPVAAHLNINNIPADTVTRFIPDMARARGALMADLTVNGTLGEPQVRGTAHWRDGNIIIPDLGINISNIQAQLQSLHGNRIQYAISANSGDGSVSLKGTTQLDPAQGWPTDIKMTSEQLEVVDIPEAYILIDSNTHVAMQGNTINIDGDITVPRARLRPRSLPTGSEGLSRDVVIIDGQQDSEMLHWRVFSKVRVKLGELVDFDGFGVSGKLKGSLLLIDEPGKLVLGRGEVSIDEGIYRLRGQDLQIRRGRLIFADTFIDDPGIDVDAIREVEAVTVGVRLKGTLRQPQLSIFSEPAMSESDALTYLILGHSPATATTSETESMRNNAAAMGFVAGDILSQEIGGRLGLDEMRVDVGDSAEKTALVMGKYLSPKLYVRYFSGLVESSSVVQLRYQLSDRIQVQTEGGYRGSQSITGGDIFFTIEY